MCANADRKIYYYAYLNGLCNRSAEFWGFVVHGMGISNCEIKLWSFQNSQCFCVLLSFEQTFCSDVLALGEALKLLNQCYFNEII